MTENTIDVRSESLEPPSWMPSLEGYITVLLSHLDIHGWELSVLLTSDEVMQTLNRTYRAIDAPTDVLSFPADDMPPDESMPRAVGDIVIDVPYVERQAREFGVTVDEELRRMVIHGVLHLAGWEHETNETDREPMLQHQEALLATIKETIF